MSARRCGIFPVAGRGGDSDYPLVKVACHYDVVDVHVRARLTQTYAAKAKSAQDVKYVFPLPSDAAVCAFSAVIDGLRTIHGVVKHKDEAKRVYNKTVSQGRRAGLLQQHSADVFEVSLGNLKPGQKIAVHISYVSIIAHDGKLDSLRLRVPLTIAPNYGKPPASLGKRFSRLVGTSKPFELTMAFNMTTNISRITSLVHPIDVSLGHLSSKSKSSGKTAFDPTKAHVALRTAGMLDADVVLVLECAQLDHPRCVVECGSASAALALTLVPRFGQPPLAAQEYIFLIDRSGSMAGGRIAAVRGALQIMLRSLPARGTTFNLMSFGSRRGTLWPAAAAYAADSVREAAAHADTMGADYGGTEIRAALRMAFESRGAGPTMVLLLTDGEAWDVAGVVKETQDAVNDSKGLLRVFVLGVGKQVSTNMCDAIARAGHGVASYVGEHEKPDAKLMNLLKAARGAAVTDISIDWGVSEKTVDDYELVERNDDVNVERTLPSPTPAAAISLFDSALKPDSDIKLGPEDIPVQLPPIPRIQQSTTAKLGALYPGFRTSLFAIIQQPSASAPTPTRVVVTVKIVGAPISLEVPVSSGAVPSGNEPANLLHVLAARAFVQELEDQSNKTPLVNAQIARLGTAYGIASSLTSFVAIDEKGDPIETGQKRDEVNKTPLPGGLALDMDMDMVEITPDEDPVARGGWLQSPPMQPATMIVNALPLFSGGPQCIMPAPPASGRASRAPLATNPLDETADELVMTPKGAGANFSSIARPSAVEALARQQQFDGSFAAEQDFYNLLGAPAASAMRVIPSAIVGLTGPSADVRANIWATVLGLACLRKNFKDDADSWALLAEKAHNYIYQALTIDAGLSDEQATALIDSWLDAAKKLLP